LTAKAYFPTGEDYAPIGLTDIRRAPFTCLAKLVAPSKVIILAGSEVNDKDLAYKSSCLKVDLQWHKENKQIILCNLYPIS
jgi:hypothetical protein